MAGLKDLAATLTTKYGKVTEGKYLGCDIAMGNPPSDKPVSISYSLSQIIFLDGTEEKGRYNIYKDIAEIVRESDAPQGYKMSMRLKSGETIKFDLNLVPKDNLLVNFVKMLMGMVPKDEQGQQERRMKPVRTFVQNTAGVLSAEDLEYFRKEFVMKGGLDDVTKTVLDKAIQLKEQK